MYPKIGTAGSVMARDDLTRGDGCGAMVRGSERVCAYARVWAQVRGARVHTLRVQLSLQEIVTT